MRQLTVISAGLGTPSSTRNLANQLAQATTAAVTARGEELSITHIELRDLAVDLANAMTGGGLGSKKLDDAKRSVSQADGMIVVTPVFAASYSGLFKMFFDTLDPDAINGMPVLIAATAGTERHSLVLDFALRPLFSYLRAVVLPTGVFAATADFSSTELAGRVARAASELAQQLVSETGAVGGLSGIGADGSPVLTRQRKNGVDPEEEVTPFSQLLAGHDGH
ncbi:FMN reductase [Corynebacterium ulceribovis]|uniref:FMN reductase n=1 Tax=Corynebacterium ulceribovis TaxID=487732 RepID=UPI000368A813|nr:FMN reductase [Corynebacterium ulceribovis]